MTRVALVGGGVIGRGWAALLLAHGHDVVVTDPAVPHDVVEAHVDRAMAALTSLGHVADDWRARLEVTDDLRRALDGAEWVQENGPETAGVKSALIQEIDEHTPGDVVIASSSSGTTPSALAAAARRTPERVIVGHPFHPVHLVPLVEVIGSPLTPGRLLDDAVAFYASLGRRPVRLHQEVPGHLANRLQAALWREAYSLVERGVATVADVDAAISHGPGLRWSLLGPLATQHLSGGDGGLRHVMRHLGPPTQGWMDDLRTVRLTDDLAELLATGVDDELRDTDVDALAAERDRLLVQLLLAKQTAAHLP